MRRFVGCPACSAYCVLDGWVPLERGALGCTCATQWNCVQMHLQAWTNDVFPRVVVANADEEKANQLRRFLLRSADVVVVLDGQSAIEACDAKMPAPVSIALVDANIESPLAMDVIEGIRGRGRSSTYTVMTSTPHNVRRYRRKPGRLYGADCHLELQDAAEVLPRLLAATPEQGVREELGRTPKMRRERIAGRLISNAAIAYGVISHGDGARLDFQRAVRNEVADAFIKMCANDPMLAGREASCSSEFLSIASAFDDVALGKAKNEAE